MHSGKIAVDPLVGVRQINRMSIRDILIHAVSECDDLPPQVRDSALPVVGVEESSFDSTYLDFLSQQIELNARGDEWSQRLRDRMLGLARWCDATLINGRIEVGMDDYTIYVDPESQSVVYWERYSDIR